MRNDMLVDLDEKCALWLKERANEQGVEVSTIVEILIESYMEFCSKEN